MLTRMQNMRNTHSLIMRIEDGSATLGDSLIVSYKKKILLPYNLAITLLGSYPKKLNTDGHIKTCT